MFCTNCGKRISDDSEFCEFCGAKVEIESKKDTYPKISDKYRVEHISYPKETKQAKRHINIGRFFSNHWKKALFIIIAALIIWGIVSNSGVKPREFPQLAEPKTITFEWGYNGLNYSITETFYKTVYDYYNSNPEKDCWYEEGGTGACIKKFLEEAEEDNTISKVASDIKRLAIKNNLGQDELIELVIDFVQSIPYDDNKAEIIESIPEYYYEGDYEIESKLIESLPSFPYEVLYNNKGVCGGKSFLAVSLIKEIGYGIALFYYDEIEGGTGHIAPAVKCPLEYSSYNSGYCFAEVTLEGHKIGVIPQMELTASRPKVRTSIKSFEERTGENELGWRELGHPEIYEIMDGNTYQEVIKMAQTKQRIETLEKEIYRLDRILNSLDNESKSLKSSVDYYERQADAAYNKHKVSRTTSSYNEYIRLHSQYKFAYGKYESKLNERNREATKYNNFVYEYNVLIEDFYR